MKTLPRLALAAVALALSAAATAVPPPVPMEVVLRDMRARKPYPLLPNLDRPVFIKRASLICVNAGGLRNPDVDLTLRVGQCVSNTRPLRVSVLPPEDDGGEIEARMFGYIAVVLRAKAASDASTMIAWVYMDDLTN